MPENQENADRTTSQKINLNPGHIEPLIRMGVLNEGDIVREGQSTGISLKTAEKILKEGGKKAEELINFIGQELTQYETIVKGLEVIPMIEKSDKFSDEEKELRISRTRNRADENKKILEQQLPIIEPLINKYQDSLISGEQGQAYVEKIQHLNDLFLPRKRT